MRIGTELLGGDWRRHDDQVVCAVAFDLDGVLVDSEQLWDVVRRGYCRRSRPAPAHGGDPLGE
ncbi:MAG: hypothetical protein ACRDSZ_13070 [Pseudonocardiaceae bacterium]